MRPSRCSERIKQQNKRGEQTWQITKRKVSHTRAAYLQCDAIRREGQFRFRKVLIIAVKEYLVRCSWVENGPLGSAYAFLNIAFVGDSGAKHDSTRLTKGLAVEVRGESQCYYTCPVTRRTAQLALGGASTRTRNERHEYSTQA